MPTDNPQIDTISSEVSVASSSLGPITRRGPEFQTIYSNNSSFSMSPFDFAFTLNEVTQNEKGEVFVDQKARVVMSPLHAKIFTIVCAQNLKNFESQFGEINIPGGLLTSQPVQPETAAEKK
jgi:hypothetical protein